MEADDNSSTILWKFLKKRVQFNSSSPTVRVFREAMQSLRKHNVFCDIKFETDDGVIVFGHKVVLSSASPYFFAMFTHFEESSKDNVNIKEMESTTLKLLVDFMYTGQIVITEVNVQALLSAANLLQLPDVRDVCCDFLKTQLDPTNCIGIKAFADLHGCMELLSSSESYIQQHFSEVVDGDEFLSLPFEQLLTLISSDKLTVLSEEKVFECVICWVNHELGCRKDHLPKLMEYVRLPLTSSDYLLSKVNEEPLLKNNLEFWFYSKNNSYQTKAIYVESKVIFVVGGISNRNIPLDIVEWYDFATGRWHSGPKLSTPTYDHGLAVLKDSHVFSVGGRTSNSFAKCEVYSLDSSSSSPCWIPTVSMLEGRTQLGVAVLDNCIYAVGGHDGDRCLKSFECYHPKTNTWTPIADMSVPRIGIGVGILDSVMYAVGGHDGSTYLSSVEAYKPSTGVWTSIADMHMRLGDAEVITLDGLLYVVGGRNGTSILDSVEMYNPNTKTWSMLTNSMNFGHSSAGVVVIDKPPHLNTLNGL